MIIIIAKKYTPSGTSSCKAKQLQLPDSQLEWLLQDFQWIEQEGWKRNGKLWRILP